MTSNFDAISVLGTPKFSKKPLHEIFNEEEINAARALYEMANGIQPSLENGRDTPTSGFARTYDKKAEIKLGKRKFLEDDSTSRSRRKVEHHYEVQDTNDHNDCSVRRVEKKKFREDGLTSARSRGKVEHLNEVWDANDHDDCSVHDLPVTAVAEKFGRQKVVAGTSSKNGVRRRRSLLKPNSASKAAQISSGRGFVADQFSFSVIHLLSAVRDALITPLKLGFRRDLGRDDQMVIRRNLPILNIHDIVQRVRSKPADLRLLQCQEPLIELVRGVMKIFSTEMSLGDISWHPLTVYDHLRKRWHWIAPVPSSLNCTDVDVSCAAWGLSSEYLTKLVDQFSVWLRRVQPGLQLVASLPEPPLQLMQEVDFDTRFKRRKKLNERTISPICDEVRAYFQTEEAIRYLIPDRNFVYTAFDGQKSAVAPLRKDNNKMWSKSRGHCIFKANRPPQFSLLSLVRDAAARLPGGIGTKTDICSLVRESQYIIDDIPEEALKKIVSGALDRLHGENDPCVRYIGQWGLWTYLHKYREAEDFA